MVSRDRAGRAGVLVLLPILGFWLAAGSVGRSERGSDPGPGLTIYSQNLGLVRTRVTRSLEPGDHTVRVDGLPTHLDASSLLVLTEGVTLLGASGFRTYQSPGEGPGASIDLDLRVGRSVSELDLAFLTSGLSWSAAYAMIVSRDHRSASIDGYATMTNNSGASYPHALVQLLAGSVHRSSGGRFEADVLRMAAGAAEQSATQQLGESAFGDYHLYTVSTPLTLQPGESRRIRLLGTTRVAVEKLYTFTHALNHYQATPEATSEPVQVSYHVERKDADEFGETPLPGGVVRIYQPDEAGRLQLLGVASIPNTAKYEDLLLPTGRAFEVVGTRTQTDYRRPEGGVYESGWRVDLRNRSESGVTVRVIESLTGEWEVIESSHDPHRLSAGAVRFDVNVPAGSQTVLEFRVRVRT